MNTKLKKILITLSSTLGALAIVTTATYATITSTLTPSGTAGDDTQYSLNDIYDKLTNFTNNPTATSSPFTIPGTIEATFATLSDIYALLEAEDADLVPENIADGVDIFGVQGTMTAGPAELEWSNEAPVLLCWNQDALCEDGMGFINGYMGAQEYCSVLDENGTGWRLPTYLELQEKMTNDFRTNNGTGFPNTYYWSDDSYSFSLSVSVGYTYINGIYLITPSPEYIENLYGVRCVR